ncbi:hypothetical protein ACWEPC_47655 [Nonomuraea sp. NPDC004297]
MAEFFEVRMTTETHTRAAELAHGILLTGLATSIDIAALPRPAAQHDDPAWQLTLISTDEHLPALRRHLSAAGGATPIDFEPVSHDIDNYPEWLKDDHP